MKSKMTSRKFWISVATFLASIGTSVGGIATDNQTLAIVGVVCTALSGAIYTIVEGIVDASHKIPFVNGGEKNE